MLSVSGCCAARQASRAQTAHLAPALAAPDWHRWKRISLSALGNALESAVDAMAGCVVMEASPALASPSAK